MLPNTDHEHVKISDSCCWTCFYADNPERMRSLFIVCSVCGNKRCPKGTDHHWDCTGSNEPGQDGSLYGAVVRTDEELQAVVDRVLRDKPPTVES